VVAPGPSRVTGQVVVVGHLKDVQDVTYDTPTLLLARCMGGEEEIPAGVVAVVTESATDVLCHAAIRARNGRVIMLSCFDPDKVGEPTFSTVTPHVALPYNSRVGSALL
jgi:alpha-glucan,water dikinase